MAKRSRSRLNARLTAVISPVFLIDGDRRVSFFNRGCEELTQWAAEDVLGKCCEYTTESDHTKVASLTGTLCPPAEVFAGEQLNRPIYFLTKDGRSQPRMIHFFPLANPNGDIDCVLGVVGAIPATKSPASSSPAQQLHAELSSLRALLRRRYGISTLIGTGDEMRRAIQQVSLAHRADCPVMFVGERGTGKEHAARIIHYESEHRNRAFVPLDCATMLPIDIKLTVKRMIAGESGDEPSSPLPGLHPGSVYLSHAEALPRDIQEFFVDAFGGDEIHGGIRLMTATQACPEELRRDGVWRDDFYFLVSSLSVTLPPLRRRAADLPQLAQWFLESHNRGGPRQLSGFDDAVLAEFSAYNWPGNLDELAAVVTEAHAACGGTAILVDDLPFRFRTGRDAQTVEPLESRPRSMPLEAYLEQVEREHIELVLEQAKFNKKKAADILGITRPRLYRRLEQLGIETGEESPPSS